MYNSRVIKVPLFGLLFFAGFGYTPYIDYRFSYTIYLIAFVALFYKLIVEKIRFTKGQLISISLLVILNSLSLYSSNLNENILKSFIYLFIPISLYLVAMHSQKPTIQDLRVILLTLFMASLCMLAAQYFILPQVGIVYDEIAGVTWGKTYRANWATFRVTGFSGNANTAASHFVLLGSIIISLREKTSSNIIAPLLIVSMIVAITVFTKSRHSLGLFGISLTYLTYRNHLNKSYIVVIMAALVYYLLTINIYEIEFIKYFTRAQSSIDIGDAFTNRIFINSSIFQTYMESNIIWFGGGFKLEPRILLSLNVFRLYSENLFLKILIENGIIGLVIISIIFRQMILNIDANFRDIGVLIVINMLFSSFFETTYLQNSLFYFVLVIIGLISKTKQVIHTQ